MQYLALLYGEVDETWEPDAEAFAEEMAAYERFEELAGKAIVASEALEPPDRAITVRPGAAGAVTDGPFAETTEVLGGLYVLEAGSLDEAVDLARHIPAAATGGVEVRPLAEWSARADGPAPSGTARYLAVLYDRESEADVPGTAAWEEGAGAHRRFGEAAGDAVLGGAALHPAAAARTVRVRDGVPAVTDGPFAETTEVMGGLYLLATPTREDAVRLAAAIPVSPAGAVELRPVMEMDG